MFNLAEINKNIVRYKVPISYEGIANKFEFSKEILETMIDGIKGSPVLTHYDEKSNDYGGHTMDLYRDSNGNLKRTPNLREIGFAVYDKDAWWEEFTIDGETKNYLTTFVYLWKNRNPYVEDISPTAHQSMEVELDYTINDDGIKKVKAVSFQGMALLGSTVKPAFKGSTFVKFNNGIDELKKELEAFNKYNNVNFSIPESIKNQIQINLDKRKETKYTVSAVSLNMANYLDKRKETKYTVSAVSLNMANYLVDNSIITPDKVKQFCKYFSNQKNEVILNLIGGNECKEWVNKIMTNMSVGDKLGKSKSIDIDNSKESAVMSGSWNGQDAGFLNKLLEAGNHKTLVEEAYLQVDGDGDLSVNNVHYPHHEIKNDKLVVSVPGVQAALARARQQGITGELITHLKKHYKELGLNMDNFKESGGAIMNFAEMCNKMKAENTEFSVSEETVTMMDKEAKFMYVMSADSIVKVPFSINEEDEVIVEEDKVENMANGLDLIKMAYAMYAEKDVEIGKVLASMALIEEKMKDIEVSMALKNEKIKEFTEKIEAKEKEEKMSKVEEILEKKEFSVFTKEEKEEFSKKAEDTDITEFENMLYSVFGKKVKDNIDFSIDSKFSFIHVPTTPPKTEKSNDIYEEIKKKNDK
jgi:hypothetical protein